jgi:hypothetical protein
LPGTDPKLTEAAEALAAAAAEELTVSGHLLLAVMVPIADDTDPLILSYDPGMTPRRLSLPVIARLGIALVARLQLRWPDYARPPELGIITDGTGVGFAPDGPSPPETAWIVPYVTEPGRLIEIASFAPSGHWRRMMSPSLSHLLH